MGFGAMEKILWVDLSTREMREEPLDEETVRKYLGGYGLGARILFDRQKTGRGPAGARGHPGFCHRAPDRHRRGRADRATWSWASRP